MNLTSRLKPYNTPLTLVAGILLVGILTQLLGVPLLIRIITVMFVTLILVLGLQLYMGNSGILSFAHIGFMGIGAYTSVIFSMTPAAKAMTNPDMYPFLIPLHLPFLALFADRRAGGGLHRRGGRLPPDAALGCRSRHHHVCPAGHHPRGADSLGPRLQRSAHLVWCE